MSISHSAFQPVPEWSREAFECDPASLHPHCTPIRVIYRLFGRCPVLFHSQIRRSIDRSSTRVRCLRCSHRHRDVGRFALLWCWIKRQAAKLSHLLLNWVIVLANTWLNRLVAGITVNSQQQLGWEDFYGLLVELRRWRSGWCRLERRNWSPTRR
jgi:hypothetical protein